MLYIQNFGQTVMTISSDTETSQGIRYYGNDKGWTLFREGVTGNFVLNRANAYATADNRSLTVSYATGYFILGTFTPKTKLHVSNGDIFIDDTTKDDIMKSPNENVGELQ